MDKTSGVTSVNTNCENKTKIQRLNISRMTFYMNKILKNNWVNPYYVVIWNSKTVKKNYCF